MNLEDELNMISNLTTTVSGVQPTITEGQMQAQAQVVQPTQTQVQPMAEPVVPPVVPAPQPVAQPLPQVNQPAMVNPNAAQSMVNDFNFGSMDFDINTQQIQESNPLVKLVGQLGEVFRLHFLPGVNPKEVKVHWDQKQGHNFCCLAQAYSTPGGYDSCCATHDRSKQRFVVPVIVIPSNRGQVQQGAQLRGELKVLVVSGKTLQEIKDQASMSGTTLDQADIVATVKDTKYKTFNYAINPLSALPQIINVNDLKAEWERNATNENVIRTCGRLITRAEYDSAYSNYDYKQYKQSYNQQGGYQQAQGGYQQAQGGYQEQMGYQQGYGQTQGYVPQEQVPYGSNPYGY